MNRPSKTGGLHHVALFVTHFAECQTFYVETIGMQVVWQPDADNLYLSSGNDNLALHRAPADFKPGETQRLDHIGFFLKKREDVDEWHTYLSSKKIIISKSPKDHRDGTRSFYCKDPDDNTGQFIFYPLP